MDHGMAVCTQGNKVSQRIYVMAALYIRQRDYVVDLAIILAKVSVHRFKIKTTGLANNPKVRNAC